MASANETKALKRLKKKITIENLWIFILKAMLEYNKPIKAYEARKALRDKFDIKVPAITVYTVIYRMAKEGLIEKVQIGGETLYQATSMGKKAFNEGILLLEKILSLLKDKGSPDKELST